MSCRNARTSCEPLDRIIHNNINKKIMTGKISNKRSTEVRMNEIQTLTSTETASVLQNSSFTWGGKAMFKKSQGTVGIELFGDKGSRPPSGQTIPGAHRTPGVLPATPWGWTMTLHWLRAKRTPRPPEERLPPWNPLLFPPALPIEPDLTRLPQTREHPTCYIFYFVILCTFTIR